MSIVHIRDQSDQVLSNEPPFREPRLSRSRANANSRRQLKAVTQMFLASMQCLALATKHWLSLLVWLPRSGYADMMLLKCPLDHKKSSF